MTADVNWYTDQFTDKSCSQWMGMLRSLRFWKCSNQPQSDLKCFEVPDLRVYSWCYGHRTKKWLWRILQQSFWGNEASDIVGPQAVPVTASSEAHALNFTLQSDATDILAFRAPADATWTDNFIIHLQCWLSSRFTTGHVHNLSWEMMMTINTLHIHIYCC